jgi:hypothetical protein
MLFLSEELEIFKIALYYLILLTITCYFSYRFISFTLSIKEKRKKVRHIPGWFFVF